jgi:predicted nucleic acid-binding protein
VSYHWLDANVFIQAKNGPYSFKIAPSFWSWIEEAIKSGTIRSSVQVCAELTRGKDQLSRWAKANRSSGLFVAPDQLIQTHFSDISTYVCGRYSAPYATKFLSCADPWIIAHAAGGKGIVVTHEIFSDGRDVKIPNVCAELSVGCIGVYDALERLGLRL